jgi:hypothetical protein
LLPPQVRRPTRPRLQPKRQADPCCRGIANASAKIANCFAAVPDDRARLFRRLWNVGDGSLADACPRICDVRFVLASNLLAIGWRTGSPPKPSSTPSRNGERVFQLLSAAMSPLASKASEHHSQTRKIRFQSRFRLWAIRTMLAQSHLTGGAYECIYHFRPVSAPRGSNRWNRIVSCVADDTTDADASAVAHTRKAPTTGALQGFIEGASKCYFDALQHDKGDRPVARNLNHLALSSSKREFRPASRKSCKSAMGHERTPMLLNVR